jgi:hypothetical protein
MQVPAKDFEELSLPSQVARNSRHAYRLHDDDHWMRNGWIQVAKHPVYGRSIVATQDLFLSPECKQKIEALHIHECSPIGSIETATSIPVHVAETADPEKARYIITVDDTLAYDLVNAWPGLINHAPPDKANTLVLGTRIYQLRDIRKGDHITYDYGLDYWVFQVTHFEKDKWDRQERRVWKKVHKITEDWTVYAQMNLQELVPFDIMRLVSAHYYSVQKPQYLECLKRKSAGVVRTHDEELEPQQHQEQPHHREQEQSQRDKQEQKKHKQKQQAKTLVEFNSAQQKNAQNTQVVPYSRNSKLNPTSPHFNYSLNGALPVPSWLNGPKHW